MASGWIRPPGEEFGPCTDIDCTHPDCDELRNTALSDCGLCGEVIGYDRRYYRADDWSPEERNYEHANCAEEQIEARQKGER